MQLFNLVNTVGDILPTASPVSSPGRSIGKTSKRRKSSMSPDLCDTSDVSTDTDEFSPTEQLSVQAKLNRAKKRRERASNRLKIVLNDKNEQAFKRAQKSIARKKEISHKNNKKVKRVRERHSLQEKRRQSIALRSIENRVNRALTRAEENLKKRQGRERKAKRIERVKNRRNLIEIEKRSALLESLGHRTERATRNLQLRLEDLQGKARDEIKHAQAIAQRVRAARVIQKLVRKEFGFSQGPSQSISNAEATKLQTSITWRTKVVFSRLSKDDKIASLQSLIASIMDESSVLSFEEITALLTKGKNIAMMNALLVALNPILPNWLNDTISARMLLSVFLVAKGPESIFWEKRGNDKCSILLEKAGKKLASILQEFSIVDLSKDDCTASSPVLHQLGPSILSYYTLFNKWKNADLDDLIEKMTASAVQSWVIYLTSKEALAYIEEKSVDQNAHFQHLLKYKSSKKCAGSHIKRIRATMKKVLGEKQSGTVMNEAKAKAIEHINVDKLMDSTKAEIDQAINALAQPSHKSFTPSTESEQSETVPEIQSNANLVHQLLLMDSEDLDELAKLGSKNFSHLDNVDTFMFQFKTHQTSQWIEENNTVDGIKHLIVDLMAKMRKLVPNRVDLHNLFTENHVNNCTSMTDFFFLVLRMAGVMSKSLESENSAVVTKDWYDITTTWVATDDAHCRIPFGFSCWKSYLIASLSFLIGKADLCQAEIVNFKLIHVAPIVQANGKEYEMQHFQQRYGDFTSVESMESFPATWNWIRRLHGKDCAEDITLRLRRGFIDEILFTKEYIQIPEILSLDVQNIQSIRQRARLAVISSTLLIVAGKVTNLNLSHLRDDSLSPEPKYHKEKIDKLLHSSLPLEIMREEVSHSLVMFATKISCKHLDRIQIQILNSSTNSILNGEDPVFKLMDNRMKSLFRTATSFRFDQSNCQIPTEMKSGCQSSLRQSEKTNPYRDQFTNMVGKEASKLGFNLVQDSIVQATYDTHKVMSHCLDLYGEILLKRMINILEEKS